MNTLFKQRDQHERHWMIPLSKKFSNFLAVDPYIVDLEILIRLSVL
ncbi:MAG: hypothetical protein QXX72_03620 [Desulfurococcaceae archaeon]